MKFAVFEFICNFSFGPLELLFLLQGGPWRKSQNRGAAALGFPARRVAGGEGKVGGKGEGFMPHLMVVLARREVDGGSGSTAEQGRRRCGSPAAVLRRVPAVFDRVYSTSERRGRFWWRPNKQWGSGMAWPRQARACRRQWRLADGEMGSGRARGLGAHFIGGNASRRSKRAPRGGRFGIR